MPASLPKWEKRVTLALTEDQWKWLAHEAAESGCNKSDIVRRLIDRVSEVIRARKSA